MRLGLILLKYKNKIPYRFRGKYRKVNDPSLKDLKEMRDDFEREEINMLLLRHSYLTIEQESGYMKDLKTSNNLMELYKETQREKFRKQVTFADRLIHLKVNEAWD